MRPKKASVTKRDSTVKAVLKRIKHTGPSPRPIMVRRDGTALEATVGIDKIASLKKNDNDIVNAINDPGLDLGFLGVDSFEIGLGANALKPAIFALGTVGSEHPTLDPWDKVDLNRI